MRQFLTIIFLSIFGSIAFAQEAGGDAVFSQVILLVGFVLIFYFLFWRPQSKKAKQHRELLGGLKVNDEVLTASGIVGVIKKIDDQFIEIEIAKNIEVKMQKAVVQLVYPSSSSHVASNETSVKSK